MELRLRAEVLLPIRPEGSLCQRACGASNRMMSNWWTSVNTAIHLCGGVGMLTVCNHGGLQRFLTLRPLVGVSCSVHFGYYFYASRGDILVVRFSGVKWIGRKSRRTLKRIEPGSEPLLNETPPTLQLCPPRQNCRVDFRTRSAQTHVCSVSCGGRTGRIHGLWACGIVGSTGNRRWLVFWPYTMGIDRTRTCLPHDGG